MVKSARRISGDTQTQFAQRMGTTQSLISRYEAGIVEPPAKLLMQCVNILDASFSANVTLDALLILVRDRLRGPHMMGTRTALAHLIQSLELGESPSVNASTRSRTRGKPPRGR